ncbi:MAG: Fe-S cluster assembly protein SufD [Vulcanimicrobiaceae bacterium]
MPSATVTDRERHLEHFHSTPSGHEKPGRYWKIDPEAIDVPADAHAGGSVSIQAPAHVVAVDLHVARRDHAGPLARAFGIAVEPRHKFAHLTAAFAGVGAFIHIAADMAIDDPIIVTYRGGGDRTLFPHTVVLAERGARATIIERIEAGAGAFVCGVAEVVTAEHADVTYAAVQTLPIDAQSLFTRAARPGPNARIAWATADLGAALALCDIAIAIEHPGIDANVASLFFPAGTQHVDILSTIDHRVGHSTSQTLVKSAANGRGQARYLGNIRIAAHAQGSQASLRDDALLLSKNAHIDSIPALEIAANDVKAFHGATVGAIDDEQIFYMTTRGIDRPQAEKMIALGFFEPVIDRFPTQSLREELHAALPDKVQ